MLRILSILLLAALASTTTLDASAKNDELRGALESANRAYSEGQYDRALAIYNRIMNERGPSPNLLKNTGNTYFRMGDYPRALLHYKRAQLLRPNHPDIINNIRVTREMLGLEAPPAHPTKLITSFLNASEWAWFAWICVTIAFLIWFPVRVLGRDRPILANLLRTPAMRAIPILCVMLAIGAFGASYMETLSLSHAIVLRQDASIKVSPFPNAQDRAQIKAGERIVLEASHGNYHSIRLSDGTTGWIAASDFESIMPSS